MKNSAINALRVIVPAFALTLATHVLAADRNYSGGTIGSGSIGAGDNILVSIGASTSTYRYTYTAPDGTIVTGTETLGAPATRTGGAVAIQTAPTVFGGASGGLTIKPASGGGTIWAVLDGGTDNATQRRLITIIEPNTVGTSADTYVINLNNVMIANGFAGAGSTGGGLILNSGNASTPAATIAGDVIFYNNWAGRNGAALQTGYNTLTFTGVTIFDSNKAGTSDGLNFSGGAGAAIYVNLNTAAITGTALAFKNDVYFLNNLGGGQGSAINSQNNFTTNYKNIEFWGNAIFEGNVAGVLTADANGKAAAFTAATYVNGGAIYANTGTPIIFSGTGSVAFTKNMANGIAGAIYSRNSEVKFVDAPIPYTGNRTFSFTRNVTTTSNAANGGGAIHINDNQVTSNLTFDAANSTINAIGNVATAGSGGAFRVGGSIYMLRGNYTFRGNQAGSQGGAIYASNGPLATGMANRVEMRGSAVFDSNLAVDSGGAIYAGQSGNNSMLFSTDVPGSTIIFKNNVTHNLGGAIYAGSSGTISFNASQGDITFTNNRQSVNTPGAFDPFLIYNNTGDNTAGYLAADYTTGTPNDIYFGASGMTLSLTAAAGRTISFDGGIATPSGNTLNISKDGAGDAVFAVPAANYTPGTNTNNITATTTVNAGTFRLANDAIFGSGNGSITVGGAATLGGYGTYMDDATLNAGAGILVGDKNSTAAQTLTFEKNLTLAGGNNTLYFDLLGSTGAPGTYDQLYIKGDLTLAGVQTFDITGIGTGTYTLVTSTNAITATGVTYQLQSNGAALTTRYTISTPVSLSSDAKSITFATTMSNLAVNWAGAPGAIWQDNVGANWNTTADANEHYFRNGDSVTFAASNAGSIAISAVGVKVSSMNVDVSVGATYTFTGGGITTSNAPADTTLASTDAKLTKTGAGTLAFSNSANNFANGIDIASGAIAFDNGNQLNTGPGTAITFIGDATLKPTAGSADPASITSAIAINSGKTATLDLADRSLALAGAITGAGNITKNGANTLNITGNASVFTGTTAINAGTLNLASGATLGGAITLANATTLAGSGMATGSLKASAGSTISVGSGGSPSTLTLGDVTLDTVTLKFGLYGGTNATTGYNNSDTLKVASLTATGANTIDIFGAAQRGDYYLGNISELNIASTIVTLNGASQTPGARQGASIITSVANPSELLLRYTADYSRIMTWTGSANSTWDIATDNWAGSNSTKRFGGGDSLVFGGSPAISATINILGSSQQSVGDITVQDGANYTFTGQGINANPENVITDPLSENLAAKGKLIKTGSGTLTFANAANLFTGGIDISGGVIAFNDAAQLSTTDTTAIHFTGNATLRVNADAMTLSNNITLDTGKTGAIDTQDYTLALTGAITGSGILAKTGSGTLLYEGSGATYTGTIAINQGTLAIAPADFLAAAINLAVDTTLAASGTLNGKISTTEASTITVGLDATNNTLTTATLALANGAMLTTDLAGTASLAGKVVIGNSATDLAIINTDAGKLNITATMQGAGGINKTGTNTLTLNTESALAYTGNTMISEGTLELRNLASPETFTKTIELAGGWLDISAGTGAVNETTAVRWNALPAGLSYTGTAGGVTGRNELLTFTAGTVAYNMANGITVVINPGANAATTLAGNASNYTGDTRVDSGTLNIASSNNLGSASNTLVLNGGNLHVTATTGNAGSSTRKLELRQDARITVDGNASFATGTSFETGGARTLTKDGTGTLVFGAASTRTGATNLQDGNISMTAVNALGTGDLNLTGPTGTLSFNTNNITVSNTIRIGANSLALNMGNSGTLAGVIIGTGGITKLGSNTLVITTPSAYSGPTTIATGTLRAAAANVLSPNSDFSINGGSSATATTFPALDLDGYAQTIGNLTSRGNVMLNGATLTLGAGNGVFTNAGYLHIGSGTTPVGAQAHIHGNLVGDLATFSGTTILYGTPSSVTTRIALDADGRIVARDLLTVHGNVTGQNVLVFSMSGPSVIPSGTALSPSGTAIPSAALTPILIPSVDALVADINGAALIQATGSMAPDAFVTAVYPNRVFDADGNELVPYVDTTRNIATLGAAISPEIPATVALDAAAYLIGKTAIDSVNQRVGDFRIDRNVIEHGMDLWIHGLVNNDKIRGSAYKDSNASTRGVQIGLDYADLGKDDTQFILGIFGDCMRSEVTQPNASKTKADIYGYGLYASYQRGPFSLDAIGRLSNDDYTVAVANTPEFHLSGNTIGGSLQASYTILFEKTGWTVEPQLQGIIQRHKINSASDAFGRPLTMNSIDSLALRGGVLITRKYERQSGIVFYPRLRLSLYNESRAKTTLHFGRTDYTNDLSQTAFQGDLGGVLRLSDRIDASAGLTYFYGRKIDSFAVDLGVRFNW